MQIFYNVNNPSDVRLTSKSIIGVSIVIIILVLLITISIIGGIRCYNCIRTNNALVKNNNTIDANFYRLEFKNSIIGNERINYIYCKAFIDGEKKIFKSFGFKNKPKPLNDKSIIKVYIDDKDNYLVNVDEIFE